VLGVYCPWTHGNKKEKLNMKEVELEKEVATILARQYWQGAQDSGDVKAMSWETYLSKSLPNWMSAARGIRDLVLTSIKEQVAEDLSPYIKLDDKTIDKIVGRLSDRIREKAEW
jgi:hypothetical protein